MPRFRLACLTIALVILAPRVLFAHADTVFTIAADGTLKGVPEKYQPARITFDAEEIPPSAKFEVSGLSMVLPPCLSRLFLLPSDERVRSDGSWYHARSVLPPYFSVELRQKTKPGDEGLFEGHQLLFNLETAELIEISQWKLIGPGAQGKKIEPSSICTESEVEALKPRLAA